jgi:hypothetical protein
MQRRHRHIEFVVAGVFEGQEFLLGRAQRQGGQPLIAPDTVVDVHHGRADIELGELRDHRIRIARRAPALALLARALAQQLRLGNHHGAAAGQMEAGRQRRLGNGEARLARQKGRPVGDALAAQAVGPQRLDQ